MTFATPFSSAPFSLRSHRDAHVACRMWTRAIIATSFVLTLATATDADARGRTVHIYADTIVIHPGVIHPRSDTSHAKAARMVSLPNEGIVVHGGVVRLPKATKAKRPTKAALIACQMGPNFLGEAWRGKRYRPFTRTGRPRICMTGA